MSIVTVIPARGGSKGIPRKNVRLLSGKPLLAHTIEHAKQAKHVDRIVVSTDDQEIATVSVDCGAEVIWRPAEISGDTATSESSLVHALEHLYEKEGYAPVAIVFLQCTSPLRTHEDVDRAIEQFHSESADSLVSVSSSHRFLWEQVQGIPQSINYDYRHRPRRQDMNPQFVENGSIYIFKPWVLKKFNNRLGGRISLFIMEQPCIDIDDLSDFEIAEQFLKKGSKQSINIEN